MAEIIYKKLSYGTYVACTDITGLEEEPLYRWDGRAYHKLTKRQRERIFKPSIKICKGCGKEFPANGNQRFCCAECKKPIKKPPTMKVCDICGQPFVPSYSSQKRCSEKCAAEGKMKTLKKCLKEYKTNPERRKMNQERNLANQEQGQKDPYAWLDKINEHIRANGGKYVSK